MTTSSPQTTSLTTFVSQLGCSHAANQVFRRQPMNSTSSCHVPCLSLKENDDAVVSMRKSIEFSGENLSNCPLELLVNVSHAFIKTLDQCTNAAKRCLAQKQHQQPMAFDIFSKLQAAGNPIRLQKATSKFRALDKKGFFKESDNSIVLPLVFSGTFELLLLNKQRVAVYVRCPGTISGQDEITIDLDTERLYDNMKEQCQKVVRKMLFSLRDEQQPKEQVSTKKRASYSSSDSECSTKRIKCNKAELIAA
eukprot:CAMPEP_0118706196 /NCGR_PEP_ID=MMETSP0800-20121206/20397_1 /TAXON_ID=210618 ORGANISM="Striatella unipunctata, Strain CCMP2910" /NCGR_SAMPLE_ID=MMETSP0800 /ASSEMBLY_ACC=CAM_ASM_000638 /LENGTH=250 /DNA_ID=CAMNT_0006608651 /DNA_START=70 /DNA_END=822 /DNA_ORIENTATION=+